MSIGKQVAVVMVQTVGALVGGYGLALLVEWVVEAIIPESVPQDAFEIAFAYNGIPVVIAASVGAGVSVWLIGRFFGQHGNFLLALAGWFIGFVLAFALPVMLDLIFSSFSLRYGEEIWLLMLLVCAPLLSALLYQWSAKQFARSVAYRPPARA